MYNFNLASYVAMASFILVLHNDNILVIIEIYFQSDSDQSGADSWGVNTSKVHSWLTLLYKFILL